MRGWVGWHHHMTMVLLAMLFLLILQRELKDKAPMLTIQDVREILEEIVPKRKVTTEELIERIDKEEAQGKRVSKEVASQKERQSITIASVGFSAFRQQLA